MPAPDVHLGRAGLAAPLALAVLIALALLAALFLDAALAELRGGRASLSAARVAATAENALERGLAQRIDTSAYSRPDGTVLLHERVSGVDSVTTLIRRLVPGIVEVQVQVRARMGGFRVVAGRLAYARLRPDSLAPGELILQPLPGHWLAPTP